MADGHFPTLVSKDRDANAVGNPLYIQISDGTDTAAIDASGNLNVVLQSEYAEDSAHNSGDMGVQILAVRSDAGGPFGADGDYVPLSTDATGALRVSSTGSVTINDTKVDDSAFAIGTDKVFPMGALADETAPDSVDEGDIGAPRMTLDRKLLTRIVGASDANRLDIDASGHAQVDLAAVSVTAVPVSKDSSANSELNPIFVQNVNTIVSGEEISDYDTAVAVASDASDNHDYTVAGTTFFLESVIFATSGGSKAEIQVGPLASLVSKAVGFITKEGGVEQLFFDPPIEVPATGTGTVRVIRTNRQGQAQDVYSTIIGRDV